MSQINMCPGAWFVQNDLEIFFFFLDPTAITSN